MLKMTDDRIRILHVVASMNRGGIEVWLMHMLRHIDRERFQMDFVTSSSGEFDEELRSLGSQVFRRATPRPLKRFHSSFRQLLREQPPYQIVHSHLQHFSGVVVRLAALECVPVRIAHSHNSESSGPGRIGLKRRGYLTLAKWLIDRYATLGLACSACAGDDLFGTHWENDARWSLHPYSMPFTRFAKDEQTGRALRHELGIPSDVFVLGHVGRFAEQKNHTFLISMFAEAHRRNSNLRLLLLGAGPLRPQIQEQVTHLGLESQVVFAGVRPDVPEIMATVMNGFVFPSLYEGLGIALVEAQAAGLPCVVSDTIADEATVVEPLVTRCSLSAPIERWAEALLKMARTSVPVSRAQALQAVTSSCFDVTQGVQALASLYTTAAAECRIPADDLRGNPLRPSQPEVSRRSPLHSPSSLVSVFDKSANR